MVAAIFSLCVGSIGVAAVGLQILHDIVNQTLHPHEIFVGLALMGVYATIFIGQGIFGLKQEGVE